MTIVRFLVATDTVVERSAAPGARLLDVAQAAGQPLEGTCGGDMACATCHVIFPVEDFAKLPAASAEEEDMLDMVAGTARTSRLACQVRLEPAWETLTVIVPDRC